jgi:hypothetical protein
MVVGCRERMDREERVRAQAFNSRLEALQRSSKRFENGAGAAGRQREEAESDRTAAAVERELRDLDKREREKREARRADNLRSKEFNEGLIDHKRAGREKERQERAAVRRVEEAESAALQLAEREKQGRKQQRMQEFRGQLDEQVRAREAAARNAVILSPIESQLNRSLVRDAGDDPVMLLKLLHKVQATPQDTVPMTSTGFKYA